MRHWLLVAAAVLAVASACAPERRAAAQFAAEVVHSATPAPTATPTGPIYIGEPATHFTVEQVREGFSADGRALWRLTVHFLDAHGQPTRIMANSDVSWLSSDGYVQWQTRMRYGQPSAILSAAKDGPIAMTVQVNKPPLGSVEVHDDTRLWSGSRLVAAALGPHAVRVGLFPQRNTVATVDRVDVTASAGGNVRSHVSIPANGSSVTDTTVLPGHSYRYVLGGRVLRQAQHDTLEASNDGSGVVVVVPQEPLVRGAASVLSGKGMWLSFSTNPIDDDYAAHLDPVAFADQAARAGLQYVELRMTYGAYFQLAPDVKDNVDALIDALADRHIATVAWSVPRDTSFADLSASTQAALYATPRGTHVTALAVDLERGDMFMGGDPNGNDALWMYMKSMRDALGTNYPLVATVEDPSLEHLDNASYPYARIARYVDVLQPMAYWRMMRRKPTTVDDVRALIAASVARVRAVAKRQLPVSVGGQTGDDGPNGHPSAGEVRASLQAARSAGAIGECFFDWEGTLPQQWDALAAFDW